MRVLSRLTGDDTDVLSTAGKKRFTDLAWEFIPEQQPGRFNQAIMELGETVCLPGGTPRCGECPLRAECTAYHDGTTERLPVRIKKTKRRVEKRAVLFVRVDSGSPTVLLHRRADKGLLAGLWELPNTLSDAPLDALPVTLRKKCVSIGALPESKHLFSHIEWQMTGHLYEMPFPDELTDGFVLATLDELRRGYPLPSAFRAYTRLFEHLLCEEI